MVIRAKFRVNRIVEQTTDKGDVYREVVHLSPVYDSVGKDKEDHSFWKATPAGLMELHIDNPATFGFWADGKTYYVDISSAEPVAGYAGGYDTSTDPATYKS